MSWASSSSCWVGGGDDGGSSNPKSSSSSSGDVATSSSLSGTGTGGGGKEKLGDILMLSCSLGECGVKGKYPSLYLLSAHCFGKGHGEGIRRDINPNLKITFFSFWSNCGGVNRELSFSSNFARRGENLAAATTAAKINETFQIAIILLAVGWKKMNLRSF